jgi:hypothetical protein
MPKPIGGRGKKAPYQTTHLRIPIPIKPQIESMIEAYRLSVIDGIDSQESEVMPMGDAIELSKKLLRSKTAKVDTMIKLLTAIYQTEINKEDLME